MQITKEQLLVDEVEKYLTYQVLDGRSQSQLQHELDEARARFQNNPTDVPRADYAYRLLCDAENRVLAPMLGSRPDYDRLLVLKQRDLDHVERRLDEIQQLGEIPSGSASILDVAQQYDFSDEESRRQWVERTDELPRRAESLSLSVDRAKKRAFAPGALIVLLFTLVMCFALFNATGAFGAVFGGLLFAATIFVVMTILRPQQWKLDKSKKFKTDRVLKRLFGVQVGMWPSRPPPMRSILSR